MSLVRADERLAAGQEPELLEDLVGLCLRAAEGADVLVAEGLHTEAIYRNLASHTFASGLPILSVANDSFITATQIDHMPSAVPADDTARMNAVLDTVAEHLWADVLDASVRMPASTQMSPPAFRYRLIQKARRANPRIVL